MNWLDKVIEKHGDVIFILFVVIAELAFVGVNWLAFHSVR